MTDEELPERPLSEVSRNPFLRRAAERRATGIPQRTGGVLLTVAVAIVIFMGLVVWYASNPTMVSAQALGDSEVVHQLALRCSVSYPQLAKPVSDYWEELERVDPTETGAGLRQADLFTRILALNGDDPNAIAGLLALELGGVPTLIEASERERLLVALQRFSPDSVQIERLRTAAGAPPEINQSLDRPIPADYEGASQN